MTKLLALSLLVSTVLTGCGGSGESGGSGSTPTPPPAKSYTFEFVKLAKISDEVSAIQSECTVFDGLEHKIDGVNDNRSTYLANYVQPKRFEIHDDIGKKVNLTLQPVNGAITFDADDVPEGGYVSIIDFQSGVPDYQVLSIQKELLGDYLIRLNGDSLGTCYNKNKGLDKKFSTAAISVLQGGDSSYYQFETSLETTNKISNAFTAKINAYADEKVLAKGYNGDTTDLVAYGFTELDAEATELSVIDDNLDWSTTFDLGDLDSLAISVKQGNYVYPWFDAQFDSATDTKIGFPYSYDESEWQYRAMGTTLNWKFNHNATFNSEVTYSLDVSLMVDIDSYSATSISHNGTSYLFSAPGISSTNDLVQRSYYYTENSSENTSLRHTIYSVTNIPGEIIIPDLDLSNLYPELAEPEKIAVSMIATQSPDADFVESFMRRFQPVDPDAPSFPLSEDSISLLLTPAGELKQRQSTEMRDYTIVEH